MTVSYPLSSSETGATLLALDFDGVLHPVFPRRDRTDAENQLWSGLPALEEVLRAFPNVGILISSSWRTQRPMEWLAALFSPDIRARLVGATPVIKGDGQGSRQAEVEAWLAQHGRSNDRWVGIDDVPDLYRPGAAVVVAGDGFRAAEAAALTRALSDPAVWATANPVVWGSGIIVVEYAPQDPALPRPA